MGKIVKLGIGSWEYWARVRDAVFNGVIRVGFIENVTFEHLNRPLRCWNISLLFGGTDMSLNFTWCKCHSPPLIGWDPKLGRRTRTLEFLLVPSQIFMKILAWGTHPTSSPHWEKGLSPQLMCHIVGKEKIQSPLEASQMVRRSWYLLLREETMLVNTSCYNR